MQQSHGLFVTAKVLVLFCTRRRTFSERPTPATFPENADDRTCTASSPTFNTSCRQWTMLLVICCEELHSSRVVRAVRHTLSERTRHGSNRPVEFSAPL